MRSKQCCLNCLRLHKVNRQFTSKFPVRSKITNQTKLPEISCPRHMKHFSPNNIKHLFPEAHRAAHQQIKHMPFE